MYNDQATSILRQMPPNCAVQFWNRVEASGNHEAFRFRHGDTWKSVTWQEAGDQVRRLAAGLLELGLEQEQRVGIASSTRYEWVLADLAVMCAGGATTTVYPSTSSEEAAYILGDAECRVVFIEDESQLAKICAHRAELPALTKLVSFDEALADGDWILTLDQLAVLGDAHLAAQPDAVSAMAQRIRPDQLATLIYTSGTTGTPKGVRTLHRTWVFQGEAINSLGALSQADVQFLWLPLAHSFGKVLLSIQLSCGFVTAIDGRVDRISENLSVVKPTLMGAAPRIFEKVHARIVTSQAVEGGVKEMLLHRAFAVGTTVDRFILEGKAVPLALKLQHRLYDRLVFSKVRERFGGRLRFFISGSAALNADIAAWFQAAGIVILEGYGTTENAGASTINRPGAHKPGTVGQPLPGTEVRIGHDGEVELNGPHVMAGYHNRPVETREAFTSDGWLRTGDKGELDSEGFLTVTGRIKELFKTSGGKYVAPPALEAKFKALCPYASQFVVFGAGRNFVSALITLDPDAISDWATANGKRELSYAELTSDEDVRAMVGKYVDELNSRLNRWETVKRWDLLDHDLSVAAGELTPSLKVKRNVVEASNRELIDAFYDAPTVLTRQ